MTMIEKYYAELGTTREKYFEGLVEIAIIEKEKARNSEKTYYIVLYIEEMEYLLVEINEKTEEIKRVVHEEDSNFFGHIHICLLAENLKAKGFIIFSNDGVYKKTYTPYFNYLNNSSDLAIKKIEILKKRLLRRKYINDKIKK